jgi:hypothetical protein
MSTNINANAPAVPCVEWKVDSLFQCEAYWLEKEKKVLALLEKLDAVEKRIAHYVVTSRVDLTNQLEELRNEIKIREVKDIQLVGLVEIIFKTWMATEPACLAEVRLREDFGPSNAVLIAEFSLFLAKSHPDIFALAATSYGVLYVAILNVFRENE